ncbi:hypothetical protein qu_766 [Acanthamoeba polyphaga mimivirus]|nr:hypothetical protein [Mimivirus reunion]WMV62100.1 hypothetical protein qu_766 [Mimivirus sp.]WMV63077.1 hypothetical protein qu_766 [Acanthamoeba polyphaga mimivirus]WMV64054.1 hypothetical protein qu_766 [Mimivirus sp.]
MTAPILVRIKRNKNDIVQNCDVYIGRQCNMGGWNLPDSKWKNPFTIKQYGSAEIVCEKYFKYMISSDLFHDIPELKSKTIGCWCDFPVNKIITGFYCHGCVLIQLYKLIEKYDFDTHKIQSILKKAFCCD